VAVSVSEDRAVVVWDLATGTLRKVFDDHREAVDQVAVSADGRWAATASRDNRLLLWDLTGPRLARELYDAHQRVGYAGPWYVATGVNRSGRGHERAPHALRFGPDGRLFSAETDLIRWDPAGDAPPVNLPWRGWYVDALAAHPTRDWLAVSTGRAVRVFDADGALLATRRRIPEPLMAPFNPFATPGDEFVDVAFTADGRLVTVEASGTIRVWPGPDAEERAERRHAHPVHGAVVDPTGRYAVTTGADRDAMVWDLRSGARTAHLTGVAGEAAFTGDGAWLAVTTLDERLLVVPSAGGAARVLPAGSSPVRVTGVVTVDADTVLALRYDAAPELWRLPDGTRQPLDGAAGHPGDGNVARVTADGRYALVPARLDQHDAYGLQCWDLHRRALLWTRHDEDPDGDLSHDWVTVVDERTAVVPVRRDERLGFIVLDVPTNTVLREFAPSVLPETFVALADGGLLVVDAPELWVLPPGEHTLRHYRSFPGGALCPLPGGTSLAHLRDTELRVFDRDTGAQLAATELTAPASTLVASPDGRTLVIPDKEGAVHVFRVA
jgi:hypothetical protein